MVGTSSACVAALVRENSGAVSIYLRQMKRRSKTVVECVQVSTLFNQDAGNVCVANLCIIVEGRVPEGVSRAHVSAQFPHQNTDGGGVTLECGVMQGHVPASLCPNSFTKTRTVSFCPYCAAPCKGVFPRVSVAFTFAPSYFTKTRTVLPWLSDAAEWRAVRPLALVARHGELCGHPHGFLSHLHRVGWRRTHRHSWPCLSAARTPSFFEKHTYFSMACALVWPLASGRSVLPIRSVAADPLHAAARRAVWPSPRRTHRHSLCAKLRPLSSMFRLLSASIEKIKRI